MNAPPCSSSPACAIDRDTVAPPPPRSRGGGVPRHGETFECRRAARLLDKTGTHRVPALVDSVRRPGLPSASCSPAAGLEAH
jgi:hypothetical protein